jgi:hypothetical protein
MDSDDKVLAIFIGGWCAFLLVSGIAVSVKESWIASQMATAGLQQCVAKVNDKEEIVWKKECKDED